MSRRDYNRSTNEDLGCLIVVLLVIVIVWLIFFS